MYATVNDFKLHYKEKGIEIIENDERLAQSLRNAENEINNYLSPVYILPITRAVPYLRWATCAIALKMLAIEGESEKDRDDYNDVIKTLKGFSDPKNRFFLVDETGVRVPMLTTSTQDVTGQMRVSTTVGQRQGHHIIF